MTITDFSLPAMLEQGAEFLFLPMLGAMIYAGVAHAKRSEAMAPRVFAWSALAGLIASASRFLASWVQEGLRSLPEPHETPDSPVSFEMWDLLGSLTMFLSGLALLVAGVALVYMGWGEDRAATSGGRRRGGLQARRSRK